MPWPLYNNNNNNNNNRPDIIIKNKKEKTCTLIDVAIPADRNVVQKEAEKKLKYKSLCIEIQRMWNTAIGLLPGGSGYFTCIQNMKLFTNKFKSGGQHEKHAVATWNVGNYFSILSIRN